MRSVRAHRHGFFDLRRITLGDWIVLLASLLTVASLFMPWFVSSLPGATSQWAFTYSEWISVIVLLFFVVTLFLAIYPALAAPLRLPRLPFSPPLIFFGMGVLLLLMFVFELGKYACIQCSGSGRGYGIYVGLIASFIYLVGAVLAWGAQPATRGRR